MKKLFFLSLFMIAVTSSSYAYTYSVTGVNGSDAKATYTSYANSISINLEVYGGFGGYALAYASYGSYSNNRQLSSGNATLKFYSGSLSRIGSSPTTVTIEAITTASSQGPGSFALARASW